MKLLVSLLIIAFSGIAVARSTSLAKPIGKHRKEMWLKKKMVALAMRHINSGQAGMRMMSEGERRMWVRSKERRIRELSLLVKRSISVPDRHMWVPQGKHLKSLSAPDRHIRELLSQDDRRMRLESQLAIFLALLKSPIALGTLVGTIDLGFKHPRLVYFEDSGSRSSSMPDYRRGGSSSRHPSDIHNDRRKDSGPDGRDSGPVDSPPSSGKSSSPDDRPSKK